MLDLSSRPHSIIENWSVLRNLLATYGPDWLQAKRSDALDRFEAVGFPTAKDEEFKYLPLRALADAKFSPAYGALVDRHEVSPRPLGNVDAITLAFINGEYAPELSSANALPAGVFIGSLKDAWELEHRLIDAHLTRIATLEGKLGSTNDERFIDLNTAFISEGAVVHIPKGVALDQPIHLLFVTRADHGPLASFPRTLIILEDGSEAKLIENYLGLDGVYFNNSVTEIWMGRDAILEHTKLQQETSDSVHIANISTHQEAGSTYTSNLINIGAKIARNDVNVALNGVHTETWLNGVSVGVGEQVIDNHTRIDHEQPNCNSFEVYKSILDDHATGVFNGKIFVYQDAQKTDAKQTNQSLLLSPHAQINTKPQLEIFADDVKCTHGATVGQLREDAMFYLRSRGVPKKEAEALLIYAFAAEVLEKVTIAQVRDSLEALMFDKLNSSEALPPPTGDA
jgi:Fe-S cluster assembly protein SufD